MEQKINKQNIEKNLAFCIDPRKAFAINQYQDLFFEIHHIRTKYVYFLFRLNLDFGFRKTMTKQTVYLNNCSRKSGFRLQLLRQTAF